MTFLELISLLAFDRKGLEELLYNEKWRTYHEWYKLGAQLWSDPTKFKTMVPEELATAAMKICKLRFQLKNGRLHSLGEAESSLDSLSALEAYRQYGATIIEDAMERGCVDIP